MLTARSMAPRFPLGFEDTEVAEGTENGKSR
jgi:hypothetical protein